MTECPWTALQRRLVNHGAYSSVPSLLLLQVPDYDWYLANRPDKTQAFLKWIEGHMRDKNAFLTGIDEQFARLIA